LSKFNLWYASQPRALRLLLTINVVAYVVWLVFLIHFRPTAEFVYLHVALNPGLPRIAFEPWQLLTYAFLHLGTGLGGMLHIGFNMLWMMWIGKDYEALHGPGRILGIYVYGAVSGALLTVALHAAFPDVQLFSGIVHGASGAVMALMAMVAIHHPQQRIGLMFIGVVRLIHVVIGFMVLDILFLSAGGTSVSAHLGGIAVGFVCGKIAFNGGDPTRWANVFFSSGRPRRRSSRSGDAQGGFLNRMEGWLAGRGKKGDGQAKIHRMQPSKRKEEHDGTGEVDRILDKISEKGYDALSEREKKILLNAGGKGEA